MLPVFHLPYLVSFSYLALSQTTFSKVQNQSHIRPSHKNFVFSFSCSARHTNPSNNLRKPNQPRKVLQSISVTDNSSSSAEEALWNLFGVEIPLDARVDGTSGFFATKLGFQSEKSTMIQTSIFVLTKAAILETAALLGVGAGLAKLDLDLMSFKMSKLTKQVEAIDKKLDVPSGGRRGLNCSCNWAAWKWAGYCEDLE